MISTGFHSDLPFDQYLSIERLSPSGAKLLNRSPAHYRHQRIHPAPETAAFRVGHAVHALALEGRSVFEAGFAVAPECDRRTTVGKQVWAEFVSWSAGKAVLTASEAELVEGMAGSILDHPLAPSLLSGGDAELSLCWDDPLTGAACKGRVDLARLALELLKERSRVRRRRLDDDVAVRPDLQAGQLTALVAQGHRHLAVADQVEGLAHP